MIEINNFSKSYGTHKIFENQSITLTNSRIYALVGINGIGKSTLLNAVTQPYFLDGGTVKIDGIASTEFQAKYHYTFVPDTNYTQELKLENSLSMTISSYSLGMKQKIYLTGAFLSNAQNIILDEPFNALDPESVAVVKKFLLSFLSNILSLVIVLWVSRQKKHN